MTVMTVWKIWGKTVQYDATIASWNTVCKLCIHCKFATVIFLSSFDKNKCWRLLANGK